MPAAPLLTAGIAAAYEAGIAELTAGSDAAAVVPPGGGGLLGFAEVARAIPVSLDRLTPGSRLLEECFGPVALVAEYDDLGSAIATLDGLQPSLAASVFTGGDDDPDAEVAIAQLARRAGRVTVNAWPTGVATTWSQQHGGPWPATSRPDATSVGAGGLDRFVRPVSLQNASPAQFPVMLRPENPWGIPRRLDGRLTMPD